jgi:mannan endo-1,4-beta-mannosidase
MVLMRLRRIFAVSCCIAGLAALSSCVNPAYQQLTPAARSSVLSTPVHSPLASVPESYLGVYENDVPRSYALVDEFASTVGRPPNLVLTYAGWGSGFPAAFATTAHAHGATVLIDLDPTNVSVTSIADGRQDAYLESYAKAVRSFGYPVVISFAHEMNGDWYSWGWNHTSPRTWVKAWRHVVTIFREAGARNVTWLWTVNYATYGEGPIHDWWPGASYVTWIGIDAYFDVPHDSFSTQFASTISYIRGFADKPILIGETAVGQLAGRTVKVQELFNGIDRYHLLGLVWFDVAQHQGVYHQSWRIEGHSAEIAAFRRALKRDLSGRH